MTILVWIVVPDTNILVCTAKIISNSNISQKFKVVYFSLQFSFFFCFKTTHINDFENRSSWSSWSLLLICHPFFWGRRKRRRTELLEKLKLFWIFAKKDKEENRPRREPREHKKRSLWFQSTEGKSCVLEARWELSLDFSWKRRPYFPNIPNPGR